MTDSTAAPADAIRDRYTLGRELGRGGMATVYLAEDLKHHRQVALKVLHADDLGIDSVSTNIYAVSASGGSSRVALRFDDPARPWHRYGFRVFRERFYFTIGDRQSHIWVAELGAHDRP